MYVKQSKAANILGTINEGITSASNVLNYADQLMREKAKSDMFYAQAEFERDQKIFLQNLTREGSYENYEKKASEFLQQQKSKLQKNAKNAYTADLYDQMLTSYRDNLYVTVQAAKLQKQIEDISVKNEATLALNRKTFSGQKAIDLNKSTFYQEYANGYRDISYTKAAILANAKDAISKDVREQAQSRIDFIINKGGSLNDLYKYIDNFLDNNNYTVKILESEYANEEGLAKALATGEGERDISDEVDKKTIAADVKKQIKQQYDLELETRQNKNMNTVSEWFNHMLTLSPAEQTAFANECLSKIETNMKGNNLSANMRITAVNLFKSVADGKGTNKTTNNDKLEKAFEKTIKTNTDYYIQEVIAGRINNIYEAEESWRRTCFDDYKEKVNPDASEYEFYEKYPLGRKFLTAIKEYIEKSDESDPIHEIQSIYVDLLDEMDKLIKDEKLSGVTQLKNQFSSVYWDSMFAFKLTDKESIQAFNERMKKEINLYRADKLDFVRRNPITGNSDLQEGVLGGKKKPLLKALNELKNHPDYVYSNQDMTDVSFSPFYSEGSAKDLESLELGYLVELGMIDPKMVENGDIISSFASDGKYDIKPEHIFKNKRSQDYYKLEPTEDGKDIQLYVSKNPAEGWIKFNPSTKTKTDQKDEEKTKAAEAAKDIEYSKVKKAPNIKEKEWNKHMNDTEWLAKKIQEAAAELEKLKLKAKNEPRKAKNYQKQIDEYETWLKEIGYYD